MYCSAGDQPDTYPELIAVEAVSNRFYYLKQEKDERSRKRIFHLFLLSTIYS